MDGLRVEKSKWYSDSTPRNRRSVDDFEVVIRD